MKLDYLHALFVLIPVVGLYCCLIYKLYDRLEKLFISIIFWGLYFYGGIGASSYEAPASYTAYFLIYIAVFVFFYRLKLPVSHLVNRSINYLKAQGTEIFIERGIFANAIIFLYLFFGFTSLIYPEFKPQNLLSPPSPNGLEALLSTIDIKEPDILTKIIFYFKLLLLPFYYISLTKYVKRPLLLFVLLFVPLYLDYCSSEYIGRGMILMNLAFWIIAIYWFNPKIRPVVIVLVLVGLPVILISFYAYSLARLGASFELSGSGNVLELLFYQEINFPDTFKDILHSGKHVNLPGFFVWLATLPIPKFLLGGVQVPLLNFELSEIVLNTSRFETGFWVKLTGYVAESYYIFGTWFFWLIAVLVSRLCKTLYFFLKDVPGGTTLIMYTGIYIGFMYSRAGLGAIMPTFSNGFLLLYVYFIIKIYLTSRVVPLKENS